MGRSRPFLRGGDTASNNEHRADDRPAHSSISDRPPAAPPPSVGVELLGYGPGGAKAGVQGLTVAPAPNRTRQLGALAAVGGLVALAMLALVVLGSSAREDPTTPDAATVERAAPPPSADSADVAVDAELERAEEEAAAVAAADLAELARQTGYLQELDDADPALVDDVVVAWIRDDDKLQVRSLETGDPLGVSVLAKHDLPPLPEHVHLIGARNATWLIDLAQPEWSGKLSNTVRMVRFGSGLDSYGFISENDDGPTDFFVGSLWGPSMNGTAQAPTTWDVLPVPGRGIVVSSPTAESSTVGGAGLEPLPRRVGRVVAASKDHVVGVTCDNRLQCLGAVSRWDGSEQELFNANALVNSAVVRVSPDGTRLLSVVGEQWLLFDLAADTVIEWNQPLAVDESINWTPDSRGLIWIVADTLVAVDVTRDAGAELSPPMLVSPIGVMGPRLPESDVALFDTRSVVESTVPEG